MAEITFVRMHMQPIACKKFLFFFFLIFGTLSYNLYMQYYMAWLFITLKTLKNKMTRKEVKDINDCIALYIY